MLRLLQVPDCADALLKVVEFQRQLFKYAVEHVEINWVELEKVFGKDTTNWLRDGKQRTVLVDSLKGDEKKPNRENFFEYPYEKKKELFIAFCNDIKFHTKPDKDSFTFQLDGSCVVIKKWLNKFYKVFTDNINQGFPPSLTGLPEVLNGDYWWKSVKQVNQQYTCPICDKLLDETQSIEHFLPKSMYPALSIHPYNLFPSCKKCNNEKGNKNPLPSRKLPCCLHPYYHSLEQDSLIHFKLNNGKEVIVLHPVCHTSQEFNRLFMLPDRWNDEMYRSIIHRGFITLKRILKFYPDKETIIQAQIISRGIDDLKSEWGQDSYAYVATQWISEIAPNKWDSILEEVYSSYLLN